MCKFGRILVLFFCLFIIGCDSNNSSEEILNKTVKEEVDGNMFAKTVSNHLFTGSTSVNEWIGNSNEKQGIEFDKEENIRAIKKDSPKSGIFGESISICYQSNNGDTINKNLKKKVYKGLVDEYSNEIEEESDKYNIYTIDQDDEYFYIKFNLRKDLKVKEMRIEYLVSYQYEEGKDGYYSRYSLYDNKLNSIKVKGGEFHNHINDLTPKKIWTNEEKLLDIYQEASMVVAEFDLEEHDIDIIVKSSDESYNGQKASLKKTDFDESKINEKFSIDVREGKLPVKGFNSEYLIEEQKKKGLR